METYPSGTRVKLRDFGERHFKFLSHAKERKLIRTKVKIVQVLVLYHVQCTIFRNLGTRMRKRSKQSYKIVLTSD